MAQMLGGSWIGRLWLLLVAVAALVAGIELAALSQGDLRGPATRFFFGPSGEWVQPSGVTPTIETLVDGTTVTAIGDSVLLAAVDDLEALVPGIEIDAEIGRLVHEVIDVLKEQSEAGRLRDVVVIHIGNNGEFSDSQLDEMVAIAGSEREVVFVNVTVSREWEGPNNRVIARGVQHHPNVFLVDWHATTQQVSGLLWEDGVHLRPEGAIAYAEMVAVFLQP